MSDPQVKSRLLLHVGRLLLEYNESTEAIHRGVTATARALGEETCHVAVSYRGVSISLGNEAQAFEPIHELRYNMAVQARVHEVLDQVRKGSLDAAAATACLSKVEADTPRHPRWLTTLLLGCAAASFAVLLGADMTATAVAGLATGLGLLARQELGRRHFSLLMLPLTAAFIGALLGGLAIRLNWTQTPELILVVPALMVVPGPHFINGLLDLIDNHVPMAMARLGLAAGILLSSAAGILIGVELTLTDAVSAGDTAGSDRLNLVSDMVLAGVATCGFAMFYNTSWRQLWLPILGGMVGHGVRFAALEAGISLLVATFLGGLTVGLIAALMARSRRLPVAVIAFAGGVTMIPGLLLYGLLAGSVRLARLGDAADSGLVPATLSNGLQGALVVSGLALGLTLGARVALMQDYT